MNDFFILGMIAYSMLILGFFGYKYETEKIIKEQEKENAALRTENMRLQAALRGKRYVRKVELSNEHTGHAEADIMIK